ncbi:MAG TPA: hypothetical protein VGM87_25905 [Roseomonas sp.]|jgi:hypothetical protein
MPRNEDFDRIAALAPVVAEHPGWQPFASYLALRAQGRRPEALRALGKFLAIAEKWSFPERQSLLLWIGEEDACAPVRYLRFATLPDKLLVPHPLLLRLVVPTSSEWLAREPMSARAHFLYAVYAAHAQQDARPLDHLRTAIQLDPAAQAARARFANRIAAFVDHAQHELPRHGYLGSAAEDMRDLQEALEIVAGIDHPAMRQEFTATLTNMLDIARAWDAFKRSGDGSDFASWCTRHGGPASMLEQ